MTTAKILIILVIANSACKQKALEPATSSIVEPDSVELILSEDKVHDWEGDTAYWKIKGNTLTGEVTPAHPLNANTFFIWKTELEDFELKAEFRISESGNSGINYRSEKLESSPYALRGYQCDIDGKHTYTGQNYEERGRTTLAYPGEAVFIDSPGNSELAANIRNNAWTKRHVLAASNTTSLDLFINNSGWNECHLIVKGNRLKHYVNSVLASYVTDNDTINRRNKGLLGFQLHAGPSMKVEYRNVRIKGVKRL